MRIHPLWLTCCAAVLVTACGGGGGGDGDSSAARPDSAGRLNIALTDAPVDNVTDVVVEFAGVILRPVGNQEQCVDGGTNPPPAPAPDPTPENPDSPDRNPDPGPSDRPGGGLADDDDDIDDDDDRDNKRDDDDDDDRRGGNDDFDDDDREADKSRREAARERWIDAREQWLEALEDWLDDRGKWRADDDRWLAARERFREATRDWRDALRQWLDAIGVGRANSSITAQPSLVVSPSNVVSGFTQCEQGFDGELSFFFEVPRSINLTQLTEGKTEVLFDELVPAGSYSWIELLVNAEQDGVFDSYVIDNTGALVELIIPPERLRLDANFAIEDGAESGFVIDWNLRIGLLEPIAPATAYTLNPVLRLTNTIEAGSIIGTVSPSLLPPSNPVCTSDPNTGAGNVVYIFEGADVTPDDVDGIAPDPLVTADVAFNDASGDYEFRAAFLPPGEYTVAFTCQARDDVPPNPDFPLLVVSDPIVFSSVENARVLDDAGANVDLR